MRCQCNSPKQSGCPTCRACWACCACRWYPTDPSDEAAQQEVRDQLLQAVHCTERVIQRAQHVLDTLCRAYTVFQRSNR